jgi:hypothetical protein
LVENPQSEKLITLHYHLQTYIYIYIYLGSRGRAVDIVTLYELGDPGGSNPCLSDTSPKRQDRPCVLQSIPLNGFQGTFLRLKQPELEDDYLPPCSAEVQNGWNCISFPPVCLLVVDREKFTFSLRHACFCCYFKDANSNVAMNTSCRKSNYRSTDFFTNITGNVQVKVPEFLSYFHSP